MSRHGPETQERLLYLISPIGLLVLWQILLDGRLRRPPLRAGAERHRWCAIWQMVVERRPRDEHGW